jgi:hypothetical protein
MLEHLNSAYFGKRVVSKRPRHNIQIVNNVNTRQSRNVKVYCAPVYALPAANIQPFHVTLRASWPSGERRMYLDGPCDLHAADASHSTDTARMNVVAATERLLYL